MRTEIVVSGEPVSYQVGRPDSAGMLRQAKWVATVASAVPGEIMRPHLRFAVSSLKRGGNYFDIDNLAKPLLGKIAPHAESVWVEVALGAQPGVRISEEVPPPPGGANVSIYLDHPPRGSVRPKMALVEMDGLTVLGDGNQALGLWLAFDGADVAVGNFDFPGPIKTLIDNLWPVLGGGVHAPADHRIRELRIVRAQNRVRSGVNASLWLMH